VQQWQISKKKSPVIWAQSLDMTGFFAGGGRGIRTHGRFLAVKRFRVFSTIMTFVVFSYRFQAVLSAQNHSCIKVFWHSPLKKLDFSRGSNESQK